MIQQSLSQWLHTFRSWSLRQTQRNLGNVASVMRFGIVRTGQTNLSLTSR
jgi:hypothetical protein